MDETIENPSMLGSFFDKLKEWASDFFEWVISKILDLVLFVIDLIPMPDFITEGLTELTALLPNSLKYILVNAGLPECLAILTAGITFRLLRKFLTLFQW